MFYNLLLSVTDSIPDTAVEVAEQMAVMAEESPSLIWERLINFLIQGGEKILIATLVLVVGKFLINFIKRFVRKILIKREVDPGVKTFLMSLLNVLLVVLLIISVIGALGIPTTSFAALLAAAGVAVGMALSGNLQNFAGGVIILLFKPYRVGDFIDAQGTSGTVQEIQIFHTVINTSDNKQVFIPNGSLSSGVITNVNCLNRRRVEWMIGVEYGSDYQSVQDAIMFVLGQEKRILEDVEPFIALHQLADSSVNFVVRVWVDTPDYWGVYFDVNKDIYSEFNKRGIGFPFPQLTIHKGDA